MEPNGINLSFTVYQFKLLGYNSYFIPKPDRLNTDLLIKDISNFGRKLKLKAHFTNNLPMDNNDETIEGGGGGWDYIYFSDTDVPRENQRRAQSRGRFSHKLPTQIRGKSYML